MSSCTKLLTKATTNPSPSPRENHFMCRASGGLREGPRLPAMGLAAAGPCGPWLAPALDLEGPAPAGLWLAGTRTLHQDMGSSSFRRLREAAGEIHGPARGRMRRLLAEQAVVVAGV